MPNSLIRDAEHWRARAREMRALMLFADDKAKAQMLQIAEAYDALGSLASGRERKPPKPQDTQ
jgi:hypothetical protein